MTLSLTMLANDLAEMVADLPEAVIIGANAVCNAVVTDSTADDTLQMAGVLDGSTVSIHVPASSLPISPEPGIIIIRSNGNKHRVVTVKLSADLIEYILDCQEVTV